MNFHSRSSNIEPNREIANTLCILGARRNPLKIGGVPGYVTHPSLIPVINNTFRRQPQRSFQPGIVVQRHSPQLDPEIKRECIWVGDVCRPSSCLIDRIGPVVKVRSGRKWEVYDTRLNTYESILSEISDPVAVPEVHAVRQAIRQWRFYDQFRTDQHSSIRTPQIGTRTPVLDHNGHNLVAALRTIHEIGDREGLHSAIEDAFPGARLGFSTDAGNRFVLEFEQAGLLRPLNQAELSDGTLRYLLLVAALLTPRPPSLLVLNEPETSLHPDLLPALGRLIIRASRETQVWVVSHAPRLVAALEADDDCHSIALNKELGETRILGQGLLDAPPWNWMD